MKLVKKKYYDANGQAKINNFFAYISIEVARHAGFTGDEKIKVYARDNKIIIEKEKSK